MVHRFQETENYDDYDPVPYQGGYDQAAVYGSVRPADEESGYARADFGEDEEEQAVEYGNESNPYGHGPQASSIYGGRPTAGGVYGGGRDRTGADPDEAQQDEGGESGYGRRKPEYEDDEDNYTKSSYEENVEASEYRRPRPGYGDDTTEEQSEYRRPRPGYGDDTTEEQSGYRQSNYEERSEMQYSRTTYSDETNESGYGRRSRDDDAEDGGYGGYRSRRNEYDEEPVEEKKAWW